MEAFKLRNLVTALPVLLVASIIIGSAWPTPPQPEVRTEYRVLEVQKPVYIPIKDQSPIEVTPLGAFEITYYTAGPESTGKRPGHPGYGITRSGAQVTEGVTVAVDPKVIPLGSYLYIEGIGFRVAQDTGSAIKGKAIDVYVPDVKEARKLGRVHDVPVYLISRGEETK